jgi:hypothetical protein
MAMDRAIWSNYFYEGKFPSFPCPSCNRGRVSIDKTSLKIVEPKFSVLDKEHDGWEPNWIKERFSLHLCCSEDTCGEIVIVSGETEHCEDYDEEFGPAISRSLKPHSMFPAPPIIKLPANLPSNVGKKIKGAFALFWGDIGASANSLRTSVELLLDHQNVPRQGITKKGKPYDFDLNQRIGEYEKSNPGHAKTFHALRLIGNLGSHGTVLSHEATLGSGPIKTIHSSLIF